MNKLLKIATSLVLIGIILKMLSGLIVAGLVFILALFG